MVLFLASLPSSSFPRLSSLLILSLLTPRRQSARRCYDKVTSPHTKFCGSHQQTKSPPRLISTSLRPQSPNLFQATLVDHLVHPRGRRRSLIFSLECIRSRFIIIKSSAASTPKPTADSDTSLQQTQLNATRCVLKSCAQSQQVSSRPIVESLRVVLAFCAGDAMLTRYSGLGLVAVASAVPAPALS